MTPNDLFAHAYESGRKLVHRMVDDLSPDEWVRQPVPGANNAAWIVGHLTLTLRNGLRRKRIRDLPDFPDELDGKFLATKQVAGEQTGYGDPTALLALFDAYMDRLVAWVRGLSTEELAATPENPGPFSTTFAEGVQFGALHIAMHVGQLSTIRRSLGRPPVV
jgi:hypothetical protein